MKQFHYKRIFFRICVALKSFSVLLQPSDDWLEKRTLVSAGTNISSLPFLLRNSEFSYSLKKVKINNWKISSIHLLLCFKLLQCKCIFKELQNLRLNVKFFWIVLNVCFIDLQASRWIETVEVKFQIFNLQKKKI